MQFRVISNLMRQHDNLHPIFVVIAALSPIKKSGNDPNSKPALEPSRSRPRFFWASPTALGRLKSPTVVIVGQGQAVTNLVK